MDERQHTHRLGVSETARALFPRGVDSPSSLLDVYRLERPVSFQRDDPTAVPAVSHEAWFSYDDRKQRGAQARRRIVDLLDFTGPVHKPDNLFDLGAVLEDAQIESRTTGEPVYISPGLIAAPNLEEDYFRGGWASPGIKWANFRPALLRVEWVDGNRWTLTVIQTASTLPSLVPAHVRFSPSLPSSANPHLNSLSLPQPPSFASEAFQVRLYRFFLMRRVEALKKSDIHLPFLRNLTVVRTSEIWRYTGCYSQSCSDTGCFLNSWFNCCRQCMLHLLSISRVESSPSAVKSLKDVLFGKIPARLNAAHVDDTSSTGSSTSLDSSNSTKSDTSATNSEDSASVYSTSEESDSSGSWDSSSEEDIVDKLRGLCF
ncbi:hypothetical protein JCM8097_000393 [Rhodosporidiobolus ruineniae]